jgi:hypothetical protein
MVVHPPSLARVARDDSMGSQMLVTAPVNAAYM